MMPCSPFMTWKPTLGMQDIAPEIAAYYYNASLDWYGKVDVVLNIKDVPAHLQKPVVQDMERRRFGTIEPFPWQTDTCIGAWHYRRDIDNIRA